jgi:phosphatidate cytidylyltransferase
LKQRIITGVVAGAGFLTLLLLGSYWFAAMILLLAVIGYYEFVRMNRIPLTEAAAIIGLLGVVCLAFPFRLMGVDLLPSFEWIAWVLMFLLFTITVTTKNRVHIDQIALLFIGIIYIGLGFYYMNYTRLADPEHGVFWTILVFACIWASDSGAYFAGRAFGKHLLWPSISPKKTIEGAIGGSVLSIVVALCFAWFEPELVSFGRAVGLGLVIAIVGQMGDFIQSAYKRIRDIKDTGTILPGHGGVLDRCDSWLIVFPFVHLLGLMPF